MRNCLVLAIGLSLISVGCLGSGKWHRDQDRPGPAALLLQSPDAKNQHQEELASRVPEIPVRQKFRFCCAFGQDMGVRLGQMPIPFLKVGKVLEADDIGPHRYDGATAAIDDQEWLRENRQKVIATRQRLHQALEQLGFSVIPSQANFLWCTHPAVPLEPVYQQLKSNRILVRYMKYPQWSDGIRISVGTDDQIYALLALLPTLM